MLTWYLNLKIKTKLLMAFGWIIAFVMVLGLYSLNSLSFANNEIQENYDKMLIPISYLGDMQNSYQRIRVHERDLVIQVTQEGRQKYLDKISTYRADLEKSARQFHSTLLTDEGRTLFDALTTAKQSFFSDVEKFMQLAGLNKTLEAADFLEGRHVKSSDGLRDAIITLVSNKQKLAKQNVEDAKKDATKTEFIMWGILVFSSIFAAVCSLVLAGSMKKSLVEVQTGFDKLSAGVLTHQVKVLNKDELGDLSANMNKFIESLKETIEAIHSGSSFVNISSNELKNISTQLAESIELVSRQSNNVAVATEQVSSTINNMASTSEEMSINSMNVSNSANQIADNTNSIAGAVEEMSMSIQNVSLNAREASKVAMEASKLSKGATESMSTLGTAANEIGKVTEVIKRIAEQTNLLALNARIEAASAGDAGKGFAVVANEIKELANQSATAAEDIAKKISGVQKNTHDSVDVIKNVAKIIAVIDESITTISAAVEQQSIAATDIATSITSAKNNIANIAHNISEVAAGSSELAKNSHEAAAAVNDVATNIHGVNTATQQNDEGSKKVMKSANDLASISNELTEIIAKFKV